MYVNVKYYKGNGVYSGARYTYMTGLPLEVGDKVIAPTANELRQRAVVTDVFVEPPAFRCREITEYDPEGEIPSVSGGRQHG